MDKKHAFLQIALIFIFCVHYYHQLNKEETLISVHNNKLFLEEDFLIAVTSYNIQYGKGQDNRVDINRTIETLQSLDSDIISLQEVERNSLRSNFIDQVNVIAKELNMNAYFSPSLAYPGLYYGNAILTTFPIINEQTLTFSNRIETRTAIFVELQISDTHTIHIINTHLGLNREERSRAIEEINNKIKTIDGPIVLTGDLNSVPSQQEYHIWNDRLIKSNKGIPFQTYYSEDWQIDYIFHSSDFAVDEVSVVKSDASDHFPVTARMLLYQ
ncbi:endonuclease/exonuclease/phosphatase family protein [Alkalihalobacillus sp. MEB130]|uniref:endonuclease/exonuclease/phosphatase family protein n=1 Tax=Alkalihalobacillus sp. MEB130 TaxID=2976704 RepID=UPI0028E08169|nr:endonuclease/exonuclease/phosphatase family protein [Alkalihalobacillus sp. MEB130]MDT8861260.1 endonuclease/exonuclease/phosphatase family protein [Alkalihalobacillus sp. MEB130]